MTTLTTQFAVAKMDGILGMAYPTISENKLPTVMEALKKDGAISENIVTFNLNHTGTDSSMTLGGIDESEVSGDIEYHDVASESYWLIKVDSLKLGDKVIASNLKGIVDTGTSLMVANKSVIEDIANLTVKQDCSTDASSLPDVTFVIDGKDYTLTGDD